MWLYVHDYMTTEYVESILANNIGGCNGFSTEQTTGDPI